MAGGEEDGELVFSEHRVSIGEDDGGDGCLTV